jgi:Ni,Fe-hydrogenase maturation factor
MWRIAGPVETPLVVNQPSAQPSQADPNLMVASAPTPIADLEDREPGVSVDAIEFGAHTGTIFYVPTDTGTTTVVWLTDDDTGDTK